jgi:hypothetical protein
MATARAIDGTFGAWRSRLAIPRHYGLAAWLTAVLFTAAVLVVQHVVETSNGQAALGQFTWR